MFSKVTDFLYKLYNNPKFIYITAVVLVVLVILFVLVYFLGKKDKVIQETKRLQKINIDTFKEESGNEEKVEVPAITEEPSVVKEEVPTNVEVENTNEVVATTPIINEDATMSIIKPQEEVNVPEETEEVVPVMHKPLFSDHEEEESPINLNELPVLNDEDEKTENGLNVLNNIKDEFAKIEIPEVEDKEEVVKPVESEKVFKPSPQIFSSVYVNNNKEESIAKVDDEVVDTKVEEKQKTEENNNDDIFESKLFTIEDDDDEIELPTLKNNDKPLFDDNLGETYEIK